MSKPLILLVGKSGSGKTTVAKYLEFTYGLKMLESYTTRKPRYPFEKGHTFVSKEEFNTMQNKVAHTLFDGHDYWATQEQCDASDVYVIDPDGVKSLKRNYIGARPYKIVFLHANPLVRLYRMTHRDGFLQAVQRIIYDHKKFGKFEKNKDVYVIHRDTVANIARTIMFYVRG